MPRNYPIAIIAFDRPKYFTQVLQSLRAQQGADLANRPITLFQDGSFNELSQMERGAPADIAASVAAFRNFFPQARVGQSQTNIGVAENFDRAERWAFEALDAEAAIFLEDDLVLSPHYIRTIDRMLDMAIDDPRIGYVAAFGDWLAPLSTQRHNPGGLIPLKQNWGFGLTRHQWRKNQPFISEYHALLRGADYRQRPNRLIYDFFSRHGMRRSVSSQDNAKLIASTLTGGLCVNTTACLARYIGEIGLHSSAELYASKGFQHTALYPEGDFAIERLTDERYHDLLAQQALPITAAAPELSRNLALNFMQNGNGLPALRESFYDAEPWGSWSAAQRSVVKVKLGRPFTSAARKIRLTAAHFSPSTALDMDVEVQANGVSLGTIRLGRRRIRIILTLPPGLVGADGNLELVFISPSITSPKDAGLSEDTRKLTLGLAYLELD